MVMKHGLLIISFLLLHNMCAMEINQEKKELEIDKFLRSIDEKDLPHLIGKEIRYKEQIKQQQVLKNGILGERAFDDYYRIYPDQNKTEGVVKGVIRSAKDLYYAENYTQ